MSEHFRIDPDVGKRRLTLTLSGFWDMAVMAAYAQAVHRAMDKMDREAPGYTVLCDARAMPIQSREVADGQNRLVAELARRRAPTAVVVDQVLAKMQAERMMGATAGMRAFREIADAERWLERVTQDKR